MVARKREHKMKLFHKAKDGGPESKVWGYWLIEAKKLFSIALLKFEGGSREAYHSHAFNSISWLLFGKLVEEHLDETVKVYTPSLKPIITKRSTFHRVTSTYAWVLTFRGRWAPNWYEYLPSSKRFIELSNGRYETPNH